MKTLEDVLEEIAPLPDPDFVADMEWRMQHGFPKPARKHPLARLALPNLRPRTVAAVAASTLLALLVSVSLLGGNGGSEGPKLDRFLSEEAPSSDSGGTAAPQDEMQAARRSGVPEPASTTAAPSPPIPGREDVAPGARTRRVERSAQIALASDPADFDGLADSIFAIADRRRGFVVRSSFSQGEGGPAGGFFELRVPTAQLQSALNELSRLATVRTRSESGTDVTAEFVSLRDRLRAARAERTSLLRRLELALTDTAAGAIRRRLAIVGRRITGLRADIRDVREHTEFATVIVELVDQDVGGASPGETDEAVDDAVGTLEAILNFLIRALGVLVPVAIGGLLVWLGASYARRRARDRALA
jgi:hypothetical protein